MTNRIAQLEKLRGRTLREISARGRQEFAKLNERIFSADSGEMTDAALLREIHPRSRNGKGAGSAMLMLERIRSAPLLPSLSRRGETSAIIKQRFPAERIGLLGRAERAISGRFDLLGFSDLSFGDPIDWRFDPTTGKRTPLAHWSKIDYLDANVAGDKKVTWELNRHAHFVTLGQAYWLTGDERFAEAFTAQASSWMDANPPKLGINWASSLELSFRVIAWIWALHLFADSDRLTPAFVSRFVKYLVSQGRHIESYLSTYFSPNTHLTGEALGLLYLGAALPELSRASRWRSAGLAVLIDQLPRHIRRDGTYFEQSSYYHRYTADFYLHVLALARAADLKLPCEVKERLALALEHLMFITRPDGSTTFYGDDDGGRLLTLNARPANDFRDTLATGAALFGRGDWKFVAGDAQVETLWLLGPQALEDYDRIDASAPISTSRAFPEGGCFVMRDGWSEQSSYVLVDCGPHGSLSRGHAHADALAFEYAAAGKTWLVDPGTFTYTGDASLRDAFRTTAAHNTVSVDDQPQSVPAGPFAWKHEARSNPKEFIAGAAFDYFEGSHDGYERLEDPVTHTRSILFLKRDDRSDLPSYLIVRDRLFAAKQHDYALHYHFAPACVRARTGAPPRAPLRRPSAPDARRGARTEAGPCLAGSANASANGVKATAGAGELSLKAFGGAELKARVEDGWISNCYGQREPAPVAIFEARGEGPRQFVSFIVPPEPCTSGALWPPRIDEGPRDAQEGAATNGRSYRVFLISANESRDVISIGGPESEIKHKQVSATASIAWARFNAGGFVRGCLLAGKRFEIEQAFAFNSPATVRCCAFRIEDGSVEITIHGGSVFDLSFHNPPRRIVINESSFELAAGRLTTRFAFEGSRWKLVCEE